MSIVDLCPWLGLPSLRLLELDRRLLEGGPSWSNNAPDFDQAYADRVAKYYETKHEAVAPDR